MLASSAALRRRKLARVQLEVRGASGRLGEPKSGLAACKSPLQTAPSSTRAKARPTKRLCQKALGGNRVCERAPAEASRGGGLAVATRNSPSLLASAANSSTRCHPAKAKACRLELDQLAQRRLQSGKRRRRLQRQPKPASLRKHRPARQQLLLPPPPPSRRRCCCCCCRGGGRAQACAAHTAK